MSKHSLNLKLLTIITKKLRVLYVEDNADTRVQTLSVLQNYFDDIVEAVNGKDGLNKFKEGSFNIIFTDLDMPIMDGITMIAKIREFDLSVPIVALSAHNSREFVRETIKSGIDGYMLKPYNIADITDVITRIVLKLNLEIKALNYIQLACDYTWDKKNKQLLKDNQIIKLTKYEMNLFDLLIKNENNYVSLKEIENFVYGDNSHNDSHVRNLVSRIKRKLGDQIIDSSYSNGYILKK